VTSFLHLYNVNVGNKKANINVKNLSVTIKESSWKIKYKPWQSDIIEVKNMKYEI